MTKYLSFPGLGIEPFHIDATAFSVFGLDIKWYGIIITVGMILAFFVARAGAKKEGITDDDIYDITLLCIVFGIVGARLYYVLFKLSDFVVKSGGVWDNIKDTFLAIVNIRNGGLAIYGGLIAGLLTALVVTRIKKIRFPVLLDVAAPAALVGQILGRWGNFVNVEAYGGVTSLPWRMGIHLSSGNAGEWISERFVHPTFLYESLWNLVAFVLILCFYKKKKYNGQVFLFYAAWYGLGRFFIEGLRTDSLMLGGVRVSQLVATVTFVVCAALFVLFTVKTPKYMRLIPAESVAEGSETSEETDGDISEEIAAEAEQSTADSETDVEPDAEAESEREDGKAD